MVIAAFASLLLGITTWPEARLDVVINSALIWFLQLYKCLGWLSLTGLRHEDFLPWHSGDKTRIIEI